MASRKRPDPMEDAQVLPLACAKTPRLHFSGGVRLHLAQHPRTSQMRPSPEARDCAGPADRPTWTVHALPAHPSAVAQPGTRGGTAAGQQPAQADRHGLPGRAATGLQQGIYSDAGGQVETQQEALEPPPWGSGEYGGQRCTITGARSGLQERGSTAARDGMLGSPSGAGDEAPHKDKLQQLRLQQLRMELLNQLLQQQRQHHQQQRHEQQQQAADLAAMAPPPFQGPQQHQRPSQLQQHLARLALQVQLENGHGHKAAGASGQGQWAEGRWVQVASPRLQPASDAADASPPERAWHGAGVLQLPSRGPHAPVGGHHELRHPLPPAHPQQQAQQQAQQQQAPPLAASTQWLVPLSPSTGPPLRVLQQQPPHHQQQQTALPLQGLTPCGNGCKAEQQCEEPLAADRDLSVDEDARTVAAVLVRILHSRAPQDGVSGGPGSKSLEGMAVCEELANVAGQCSAYNSGQEEEGRGTRVASDWWAMEEAPLPDVEVLELHAAEDGMVSAGNGLFLTPTSTGPGISFRQLVGEQADHPFPDLPRRPRTRPAWPLKPLSVNHSARLRAIANSGPAARRLPRRHPRAAMGRAACPSGAQPPPLLATMADPAATTAAAGGPAASPPEHQPPEPPAVPERLACAVAATVDVAASATEPLGAAAGGGAERAGAPQPLLRKQSLPSEPREPSPAAPAAAATARSGAPAPAPLHAPAAGHTYRGVDTGGASAAAPPCSRPVLTAAARQPPNPHGSATAPPGGPPPSSRPPPAPRPPRNHLGPLLCSNCGTAHTPLWRKDRATGLTVCNACGIYKQTHGCERPVDRWNEGPQPTRRSGPAPRAAAPAAASSPPPPPQYVPVARQGGRGHAPDGAPHPQLARLQAGADAGGLPAGLRWAGEAREGGPAQQQEQQRARRAADGGPPFQQRAWDQQLGAQQGVGWGRDPADGGAAGSPRSREHPPPPDGDRRRGRPTSPKPRSGRGGGAVAGPRGGAGGAEARAGGGGGEGAALQQSRNGGDGGPAAAGLQLAGGRRARDEQYDTAELPPPRRVAREGRGAGGEQPAPQRMPRDEWAQRAHELVGLMGLDDGGAALRPQLQEAGGARFVQLSQGQVEYLPVARSVRSSRQARDDSGLYDMALGAGSRREPAGEERPWPRQQQASAGPASPRELIAEVLGGADGDSNRLLLQHLINQVRQRRQQMMPELPYEQQQAQHRPLDSPDRGPVDGWRGDPWPQADARPHRLREQAASAAAAPGAGSSLLLQQLMQRLHQQQQQQQGDEEFYRDRHQQPLTQPSQRNEQPAQHDRRPRGPARGEAALLPYPGKHAPLSAGSPGGNGSSGPRQQGRYGSDSRAPSVVVNLELLALQLEQQQQQGLLGQQAMSLRDFQAAGMFAQQGGNAGGGRGQRQYNV
ncbi:GATA factor SREP [Tetrabaena socialis]|uniref:GATA factor SREP n=1 Tax=Tetrabaena socialis TaxID=47790 RepID=A0A2J7ZUE2_9CHLO|nr:GATA factor SREP [Tetrabaena socialis]|eukprot:PNH03891.1 GATA factor SREP [Tetrabaena socialis]